MLNRRQAIKMSKHESALRETYLRCQESLKQKESLNKQQKSMELKQERSCIEQESSNEAHMLITTNQESIDLGVTIKQESLEPNDDNTISSFASVWVKVEEENNSESAIYEPEELSESPLEEVSPSTIRDSTEEPLNKKPRISVAVERLSAKGELNHAISSILGTPAVPSPMNSQCSTSKKKTREAKKEIQCNQCEYTTGYKNCFALHMLSHNETKPYSCSSCDYSTKYPTSLSRHMVMKHEDLGQEIEEPNNQVYNCPYCDYTTTRKWNLNSHKRKHKLKQFKCQQCDYETAYRHNFAKHSKTHEKKTEFYKCDKCPFVTRFEGHISRHLSKIHNEVTDKANKCDYCDFSTPTKWRLNVHKQRSRQANTMKCSFCEFETYYMCQRKRHKFIHSDEINKNKSNDTETMTGPIKTNSVENNKPKSVAAIENTEELIENEENVPEEDKPDAKSQEYTLDPDCVNWKSIQVLYTDGKDKPFQCHMCDYTARFKSSVQRHFQRHHTGAQSRPYKCVNCDFSTKTKDQIALHNKRSKSETKMHCNSCDFTTTFKCQYVTHQKSHYSHKCSKCSYTCKNKYDLQKHFTNVHMGDGLKCQYCEYKASRKESLLCHETIHTGDKPFKCTYCSYMSVRRCLLDNHIKRNHSEKINVTVVRDSKIQSLKLKPENVQELVQLELTNFK